MNELFEVGSEQFDREIQPLVSIAYSLKRIADLLSVRNEYGEAPAEAIGGNIARALRHQ